MENPEEILHSLEEFSKLRPKDIPRELEEYLCFVAKTGDPVYQWSSIKSLFREKLINVITEFYESCSAMEIPPCPNVDVFNYDLMKNFILEKLDTFAAAPFTIQRICELLTTPRKEYNRIDKYMRALEKNILVVSTTEPGNRRSAENGESIMNGIDSENGYETNNSNNDINVEEMDDTPSWPRITEPEPPSYPATEINEPETSQPVEIISDKFTPESTSNDTACTSSADTVITKTSEPYVSIEPVASDSCARQEAQESDVSVTITAIPAAVQKRRDSIEPVVSSEQSEVVRESDSSSIDTDILQKEPTLEETTVTSVEKQDEIVDSTSVIPENECFISKEDEVAEEPAPHEYNLLNQISPTNKELTAKENTTDDLNMCEEKSDIVLSEEVSESLSVSIDEVSKSSLSVDDCKNSLITSSTELNIQETEPKEEIVVDIEANGSKNEAETLVETAESQTCEIVETKDEVANDEEIELQQSVTKIAEIETTPMDVDIEDHSEPKDEVSAAM